LGEQAYERKIAPLLTALGDRWTFLGVLQPDAMAAFFKSCDVTVLPSINSTETFGLVQIESMICGTPVVAAGLPGVREPVRITGMGKVVPPRDPVRLADAVLEVLADRPRFVQPAGKIIEMFSPDSTAARYEALFEEIANRKKSAP
jgi:glycosyltransferase involved in cell wall biosynthesis